MCGGKQGTDNFEKKVEGARAILLVAWWAYAGELRTRGRVRQKV